MGVNGRSGSDRRVAELDRQIEGRWALINQLFEDVEQLVDERDGLLPQASEGRAAGRPGMLARLVPRRRAPAAGEAAYLALTEEHGHRDAGLAPGGAATDGGLAEAHRRGRRR